MEVVDKLRKAAKGYEGSTGDVLENAAQLFGPNSAPFGSVLFEAIADAIEQEVAENYMELPKDADGVPIHVRDVMQWVDDGTVLRTVKAVGQGVFLAWSDDCGRYMSYVTGHFRHYQSDTWEQILADAMGCTTDEIAADDDLMDLVARCKALAGGAE